MSQSNTDVRCYFIELLAFWQGSINSTQVSQYFGISRTQAQKYLSYYQQEHPENLVYQPSLKGFVASQNFSPVFISCDASEYLDWLDHNGLILAAEPKGNHRVTSSSLSLPRRYVTP